MPWDSDLLEESLADFVDYELFLFDERGAVKIGFLGVVYMNYCCSI